MPEKGKLFVISLLADGAAANNTYNHHNQPKGYHHTFCHRGQATPPCPLGSPPPNTMAMTPPTNRPPPLCTPWPPRGPPPHKRRASQEGLHRLILALPVGLHHTESTATECSAPVNGRPSLPRVLLPMPGRRGLSKRPFRHDGRTSHIRPHHPDTKSAKKGISMTPGGHSKGTKTRPCQ